jgi:transglutaminase-like putative cysteine protease
MNVSDLPEPPPNSLAVRVGCSLVYKVNEPTTILLQIQPRPMNGQLLVDEELILGTGECMEQLVDSHGNLVLRTRLVPGLNEIRHDAIFLVPDRLDNHSLPAHPGSGEKLPLDVLRYTLPSRYCESDRLAAPTLQRFGHLRKGMETVLAICDWTHRHLQYRYGSGDPSLSACEAIERGYGVCRDFAHVMVALCRALDMPARYVAGHMPLFEVADSDIGIDFHAYAEVYLDGAWHIFDPRHNKPHVGRIKIAHGMDAVDAAFATIYGHVETVNFQVWAYQVDHSTVRVGDPVHLPA